MEVADARVYLMASIDIMKVFSSLFGYRSYLLSNPSHNKHNIKKYLERNLIIQSRITGGTGIGIRYETVTVRWRLKGID